MRLSCNKSLKNLGGLVFGLAGVLMLSGCWMTGSAPVSKPPVADNASPDANRLRFDPLRIGDGIRIDFSGTPTPIPSIQTEIKGDGTIRLDFIGDVVADGKTPGELERVIQTNYVPVYYTHLNVTVTPTVRFFYVEGEINPGSSGRIPYSGPITVTRAIAAAGDFDPFADKKRVRLYRVNATKAIIVNCIEALDNPSLDLPVYPGDKIVVRRRNW
jgi:protein involved in polysaccharide export with SLBB domain